MDDKAKFLVFRVYSDKERPYADPSDKIRLYGWTPSKSVVNAFLSQRNKDKYKVKKVYDEDLALYYSETDLDRDLMIDFIPLKIVVTGEEVKFFITSDELKECEKRIQKLFRDKSSIIDRPDGSIEILELFVNLDEYFAAALNYLGFRPPELESMFDMSVYRDVYDSTSMIECALEDVYSGSLDHPEESYVKNNTIPGLKVFTDVSNKIVYSLESFIKVLREDM